MLIDIVARLRDPRWTHPPHSLLLEAAGEVERLRRGIQDYLDGDYGPKVKKYDKCPHGQYGYEICEACIDAHFTRLLTSGQRSEEGVNK